MKFYDFKVNFNWTHFAFGVSYSKFYLRGKNYEPIKSLIFMFAFWTFGGQVI